MLVIDTRRSPAWSSISAIAKAAFIALMGIRLLCAALWTYMAVRGGGFLGLLPACWNVLPGAVAPVSVRVAAWLVVTLDAVVIVLGLLALPGFGHLHGGEIFA